MDGFLLHPLGYCVGNAHQVMLCKGYNFWSGIAGSFASDWQNLTLPIMGALFLRHHNCHVKGCWRLGHPHPEHHWPSCRRHWDHELEKR
jgi:hypothetical protein